MTANVYTVVIFAKNCDPYAMNAAIYHVIYCACIIFLWAAADGLNQANGDVGDTIHFIAAMSVNKHLSIYFGYSPHQEIARCSLKCVHEY